MSGEQHPPDVVGWFGLVMMVLGFVAVLGFESTKAARPARRRTAAHGMT